MKVRVAVHHTTCHTTRVANSIRIKSNIYNIYVVYITNVKVDLFVVVVVFFLSREEVLRIMLVCVRV